MTWIATMAWSNHANICSRYDKKCRLGAWPWRRHQKEAAPRGATLLKRLGGGKVREGHARRRSDEENAGCGHADTRCRGLYSFLCYGLFYCLAVQHSRGQTGPGAQTNSAPQIKLLSTMQLSGTGHSFCTGILELRRGGNRNRGAHSRHCAAYCGPGPAPPWPSAC
jgi:hypothetical protein